MGTLCDQSALLKHGDDVLELMFLGVGFDVSHQLRSRNAQERIADPEILLSGGKL